MDIIAITVSTNYEDYLSLVLKENHTFFKKWYVITDPKDEKTKNLCSAYSSVECLLYDLCIAGHPFRKGNALNMTQKLVYKNHPEAIYLIIDSDICLPKDFFQEIKKIKIADDTVYGADRLMYPTIKDFLLKKNDVKLSRWDSHTILGLKPAFWMVPFGYFQLYKTQHIYPNSRTAEGCDVRFASKFTNKINLPFVVSHIGTPEVNWEGRVSKKEN
jgi:hypothetical protein